MSIDKKLEIAVKETFMTEQGKIVLKYLADVSGFLLPNMPRNEGGTLDKDALVFNEGMRTLYLELRNLVPKDIVFEAENLTFNEE